MLAYLSEGITKLDQILGVVQKEIEIFENSFNKKFPRYITLEKIIVFGGTFFSLHKSYKIFLIGLAVGAAIPVGKRIWKERKPEDDKSTEHKFDEVSKKIDIIANKKIVQNGLVFATIAIAHSQQSYLLAIYPAITAYMLSKKTVSPN